LFILLRACYTILVFVYTTKGLLYTAGVCLYCYVFVVLLVFVYFAKGFLYTTGVCLYCYVFVVLLVVVYIA